MFYSYQAEVTVVLLSGTSSRALWMDFRLILGKKGCEHDPCLTVPHPIASYSLQLLFFPPLPLSHPNRDLQKNQFPLPSGEGQCFTTVSDWWHAVAISHPAAFYSATELVAIQRIFMANNNRRCNSYSLRWVNLSRETWGWPAQTAGGQSHVNKLLRLNDWVHGCEQFKHQTWRPFWIQSELFQQLVQR